MEKLEIFLVVAPGLEEVAAAEAREQGFAKARVVPGGVVCRGAWPEVWRANLVLRVPGRVLLRLAGFRAMSFRALEAGLDAVDWGAVIAPGQAVRAEASTKHSKLYHAGAVKGRLEQALARAGAVVDPEGLRVLVRIEENRCVVSVDTSGDALHRRGFKEAVNRAPMRETMAAGSCGRRAMPAARRCWTRCAARGPSASRPRRSPQGWRRGAGGALPSRDSPGSTRRRSRRCGRALRCREARGR